ncbi:hypothetical protein [Embleya sp. NPDC059237]|uniref:hypothetical protein n=1 Tax=Embleya sp. NPDC059237 TaxID=3346784 RepID=UPI0036ABAC63
MLGRAMAAVIVVGLTTAGCADGGDTDPRHPFANAPIATTSPPRILVVPTTAAPTAPAESPLPPLPTAPGIPTEVDSTGRVGEWLRVQGAAVRVRRVTYDPCLSDLFPAGPGRTYALVEVDVRNDTYPGTPMYGAFDWELQYRSQGAQQKANVGVVGCREFEHTGGVLTQGTSASTILPIEIPGDARDMVLAYDGMTFFGTGPRVRISLGR